MKNSFIKLKENFYKQYKITSREEDTPIPILILKDMIESLPPAINIIQIDGPKQHEFLKNGRGFLLDYDFEYTNSDKCNFCGIVNSNNSQQLVTILTEQCGYSQNDVKSYSEDLCKEFNITGWEQENSSKYLHFVPDDIIKDPLLLEKDLKRQIIGFRNISSLERKFQRNEYPDFNKLFNLEDDTIFPEEQIFKMSESTKMFGLDLQKIQKHISSIQLIPLVPEPVQNAFSMSKNLFIFGYFQYRFFTIAQHYAFLALESAIKWCYAKSLKGKAILQDFEKKELLTEIEMPEYSKIHGFCNNNKKVGWNAKKLLVNGEKFPHSGTSLIDWLEKKHLIRKWEKNRYNAGISLRNSFSHLEYVSILTPRATPLQNVANQINQIFYNLDKK